MTASLRQTEALGQARLARIGQRLRLARPDMPARQSRLERLGERLRGAWLSGRDRKTARLSSLEAGLAHLDPRGVMARGYSLVRDAEGNIVRDSRALEPNDAIAVFFHSGRADAAITRVEP
jgi:exodeoxyribonuclease VII large subunit